MSESVPRANFDYETTHYEGLSWECTCGSAPEQYDVRCDGVLVAYVRCRFRRLTVECPDIGGSLVLERKCDHSAYCDIIDPHEYKEIADAIWKWVENARTDSA